MTENIYKIAVQRTIESSERAAAIPTKKPTSERVKAMHRKDCKKYYESHKTEIAERNKVRKSTPEYKEKAKLKMREWRKKHPGYFKTWPSYRKAG